jgi:hypothetical protein
MALCVTVAETADRTVIRVDGRLADEGVAELELARRCAKRPTVLDLTNLVTADDTGVVVLRRLVRQGANGSRCWRRRPPPASRICCSSCWSGGTTTCSGTQIVEEAERLGREHRRLRRRSDHDGGSLRDRRAGVLRRDRRPSVTLVHVRGVSVTSRSRCSGRFRRSTRPTWCVGSSAATTPSGGRSICSGQARRRW